MSPIAKPPLASPTDLGANAAKDITGGLNALLADTFALYLKTKNFHWHISGPHFRDYHLMLDDHGYELFAMTDVLAPSECARSAARPYGRSAISRASNVSLTTTPPLSRR
jgi:DNA-binding ferritin-like protein